LEIQSVKMLTLLLAPVALVASAAIAQTTQPAAPAPAAAAQPSEAFTQRANDVLRLINGEGDPAQIFNPAFLAQVSADRVRSMSEQIRTQAGRATAIEQVQANAQNQGTFVIRLERITLNAQMALDPAAPHQIQGLMVRPAGS
jgi:hypothetical protein